MLKIFYLFGVEAAWHTVLICWANFILRNDGEIGGMRGIGGTGGIRGMGGIGGMMGMGGIGGMKFDLCF